MTTTPRWTLSPRSTLGLAVALALLLVVGLASLWQLQSLRRATQKTRAALEVQNSIEAVTRRLVDVETGQRGYLLTGRPAYLDAFAKARDAVPAELAELRTLTTGDATQRGHLDALTPLIAAKLDELTRTVELRRTLGFDAAVSVVDTDAGQRIMDDIRRQLDAMARVETTRFHDRLATSEARDTRVLAIFLLASGFAFALVGGTVIALNAQGRRRVAAQTRLLQSEERLRVTLRSIGDAVIATDAEGRVVFMNAVAELLTGWSTTEAHGRPLDDVFVIANETTRENADNPVTRVLREGITVGLANHTVLFARDGREIPIDDSAAPIRDTGRVIMGVVLVFRDVTERRRLESEAAHAARLEAERAEAERSADALRNSEERYRSLVAASMDIIWTAGPLGTFDEPQPGWEAYTGQRWPQDAEQGWATAVHPDDRDGILRLWEAARLARSLVEVEGRVWHAVSGEYHHCRGRGVPLLAADGTIRQWVGMIEDVHARRAAELQNVELLQVAERARQEAESANHAKDEFLSVLSHELRSPLQTMLTWIRLLRDGGATGAESEHAFDALTRSLNVQEKLINDLLDVSRIVSGKLTIESAPFDLTEAAAACVDRLQPEAAAKRVTLERHGLDGARPVLGDPTRFTQALHNVLENALKFTPAGGRVDVRASTDDGRHALIVHDTGDGIAPDLLTRIFDRFWQADSGKTRRHGGLGLGLAIARHLVEAQGGTLVATSAGVGKGATFTFSLRAADAVPAVAAAPERAPASLDGVRVLLVEDDEAMSEALAALLEHHGAHVTLAASVRTALGVLDAAAPDVLLSDIGMPGESGYTLIDEIRAREAGTGRRLPAVAMTGFASPEDRDEARARGFDDHLPKPVDPEMLVRRLRTMTERGA